MTNTIWTAICAATVGAATVGVMAQPPAAPPANSPSADARRITVTGCLRQAPASADTTPAPAAGGTQTPGSVGTTGTTGAAGAATGSANAQFVLADATLSTATSDNGAAAAGSTPPTGASTAPTQTYRLIANPAALMPHIGKKVELTGTLADSSASGAANDPAAGAARGPVLKVEAGKVLGTSCQQ